MYPTNISAILLLLVQLLLLLILIIHKMSETISRMEKVPSREILIYRKVQKST
jgi:Na+-transporting methylmalonyl-CoA/oxaloacetate decarboxylase gamma subunit